MSGRTNTFTRRGFTLIEVLVAATLSLVVVVALQALLVGSLQRLRAVEQRVTTQQEATAELDLLADDLASLAAVPDLHVMRGRLWFAGLNCLCAPTDSVRRTVRIEYEWQPNGTPSGGSLVRHEAAFEHLNEPHSVRLSNRVVDFQVAVWDGKVWHNTWPLATPRPATRLRVMLRRGDGRIIEREYRLAALPWKTHHD